ncbi:Ribosomal biogenesis [Cinnamomum micranthum f. kanehirae]|uniref:Ribosomal biogenesis n=1 Tax=Cinnamomum micranthum f. kanehirae TaxID=337451 RepID=A0A443PT97_9MAGN|nr:Ribosomal biogenesis [Cinnamomum micranthum f. kanehirae]
MVRPYAVKGRKRKKREVEVEVEEEEEEEEQSAEETHEEEEEEEDEKKEIGEVEGERNSDEAPFELPGIPILPSNQKPKAGVIFVLERASLEVAKVGKTYQILNSDDHSNFLRKHNRNPADYRPDIVHQALLAILDSPLNKAGRIRALYVKTEKGVLFEVKPHVRMPRTFKRFCGVMLQLLQKLSITATSKREKLLRVIKNPVTRHLPVNSRKIGFSYSSEKLVQLRDYVAAASNDIDLVFVVGAMAHGKIDKEYTDDFISVSGYPLSAACCIGRICNALEEKWNIL